MRLTKWVAGRLFPDVKARQQAELRERVFLRAIELLTTRGWVAGAYGMEQKGPFCLLGAVAQAMTENGLHVTFIGNGKGTWGYYSTEEPAEFIGEHSRYLYGWNDIQKTSEPVLEYLTELAKEARRPV